MNVLLSEIRRSLIELDKGNSTTVCSCLLFVISTSHKSFLLSCVISNSEIFHRRQFDLFFSLRILSKSISNTIFPLTSPHLNPSHSSLENISLSFLAEKIFLSHSNYSSLIRHEGSVEYVTAHGRSYQSHRN